MMYRSSYLKYNVPQVAAPDPSMIPTSDLLGVTVLLYKPFTITHFMFIGLHAPISIKNLCVLDTTCIMSMKLMNKAN